MDNLPADLATLSELSDSSILSCLEERFRNQHCQSYVGQVLMSVDPLWPTLRRGPQATLLTPEFAADVLHGASVMREDQSVVLSGHQGSGKTVVLHQLLGSLIAGLDSSHQQQKVIDAMWLLQAVSSHSGSSHDGRSTVSGNQALVGVRLFVKDREFLGSAFSCVLLNTNDLCRFSVFELSGVRERLEAVGVSSTTSAQFMKLLVELDLLSEGRVSKLVTVSESMDKPLRKELAEQLYAYLVRWLVCWLNKELAPPSAVDGYTHVDIFDPPGVHARDQSSKPGDLVDLTQQHINEVLHNMYCHRLFIWEQEQYIEDELEWEYIHVQTNQLLIEAFQEEGGGVLDAVSGGSARDMSLAVTRACLAHPEVCFTTEEETSFIFSHFTGDLCYTITEDWPRANSIHLSPSQDTLQSLLSSPCDLLRQLADSLSSFSPDCLFGECWDGALSLMRRLKLTTHSVMELITTSQPNFVLCLSPQSSKRDKVADIDRGYMLTQLQHLRVLDIALIQSCGYPVHLEHGVFAERYSSLLIGNRSPVKEGRDVKAICQVVLSQLKLTDYRIGNSQVFLKPWHLRQLDSEVDLVQMSARKLQLAFRRSCLRRQSERFRLESAVKNALEERDEYDVVSTDSGSGGEGEGEGERVNGEEERPPSPPPRPEHTLSRQSFAVERERTDQVCPLPNKRMATNNTCNVRAAPPVTSNHLAKRKSSWRKHRPAVPPDRHTQSTPEHLLPQRSWYHGKISRDGAERCLKDVSFDCFLVRESEKRPGEYSLSLKHKTVVKHFRVDVKRGSTIRYELFGAQKSFPSLSDLIDYYTRHCITTAGETLTAPCPSEGTSDDTPPPLPPPRRKNLSSIRRKEPPPAAREQLGTRSRPPAPLVRTRTGPETRPLSVERTFDLSDESVQTLLKELEIEERIVDAARRMADMPAGNRKERQQRRRSLQQAQSRLLSLRQQYHTIQERRRFIEVAVSNIPSPNRRISAPNFNIVH